MGSGQCRERLERMTLSQAKPQDSEGFRHRNFSNACMLPILRMVLRSHAPAVACMDHKLKGIVVPDYTRTYLISSAMDVR